MLPVKYNKSKIVDRKMMGFFSKMCHFYNSVIERKINKRSNLLGIDYEQRESGGIEQGILKDRRKPIIFLLVDYKGKLLQLQIFLYFF